jgi:hypothetical protein
MLIIRILALLLAQPALLVAAQNILLHQITVDDPYPRNQRASAVIANLLVAQLSSEQFSWQEKHSAESLDEISLGLKGLTEAGGKTPSKPSGPAPDLALQVTFRNTDGYWGAEIVVSDCKHGGLAALGKYRSAVHTTNLLLDLAGKIEGLSREVESLLLSAAARQTAVGKRAKVYLVDLLPEDQVDSEFEWSFTRELLSRSPQPGDSQVIVPLNRPRSRRWLVEGWRLLPGNEVPWAHRDAHGLLFASYVSTSNRVDMRFGRAPGKTAPTVASVSANRTNFPELFSGAKSLVAALPGEPVSTKVLASSIRSEYQKSFRRPQMLQALETSLFFEPNRETALWILTNSMPVHFPPDIQRVVTWTISWRRFVNEYGFAGTSGELEFHLQPPAQLLYITRFADSQQWGFPKDCGPEEYRTWTMFWGNELLDRLRQSRNHPEYARVSWTILPHLDPVFLQGPPEQHQLMMEIMEAVLPALNNYASENPVSSAVKQSVDYLSRCQLTPSVNLLITKFKRISNTPSTAPRAPLVLPRASEIRSGPL